MFAKEAVMIPRTSNQRPNMNTSDTNTPQPRSRYSRKNPPASEEIALERMDCLNIQIPQIEVRLDHEEPEAYPDEETYQGWRRRAIALLGFHKTELSFLEKWVARQQAAAPAQNKSVAIPDKQAQDERVKLDERLAVLQERIRGMAEKVERQYSPVYSAESLPENVYEAHRRVAEIGIVRIEINQYLSEAEIACAGIFKPQKLGLKSPLQVLLNAINKEAAILKEYIRTQAVLEHQVPLEWRLVCAQAIARAVKEGLVLTPEEQPVFDALQIYARQCGVV
jgi:hypothetical protein